MKAVVHKETVGLQPGVAIAQINVRHAKVLIAVALDDVLGAHGDPPARNARLCVHELIVDGEGVRPVAVRSRHAYLTLLAGLMYAQMIGTFDVARHLLHLRRRQSKLHNPRITLIGGSISRHGRRVLPAQNGRRFVFIGRRREQIGLLLRTLLRSHLLGPILEAEHDGRFLCDVDRLLFS